MRLMHYFLDINGGLCFQKTYMNSNKSLHAIKNALMYRSTHLGQTDALAKTKIKIFKIFYGTGISCHNSGIHPHSAISNYSHALFKENIHPILYLQNNFFCRNRKFYGKTLLEVVQSPGETIYMPNYQAHAVYNLDETVAVGDNPFFNTAIEESAFDLLYRKINEFGRVNGTEIIIKQGL